METNPKTANPKKKNRKRILGREEVVKINGKKILAKIDTGAYNCSIDRELADRLELGPAVDLKKVKNVHGQVLRRVIQAEIVLKRKTYPVKFTVSDRKDLRYDVILGRMFLRNKFLVDVSKCVSQ
jgi:hypothetical protein